MKKSAIVLSLLLILSVAAFTGCGGNDRADVHDGTAPPEASENIVDETEKGAEDMVDDVGDGVKDMVDDAEDLMDGDDSHPKDKNSENKSK